MAYKVLYEPSGKAGEYAEGLALNQYNGCSHGCPYCYVPGIRRQKREAFFSNPQPRPNVLENLGKDLKKVPTGSKIFMSFTTDPYQPIEAEHQLTRRAIEMIHEAGSFVKILTKAGPELIYQRDRKLFGPGDEIGVTLDAVEATGPGVPAIDTRLEVLVGFINDTDRPKLWVSMEPVAELDIAVDLLGTLSMFPLADYIAIGPISRYKKSREIEHISLLHTCREMINCDGMDIRPKAEYRELWKRISGKEWNSE